MEILSHQLLSENVNETLNSICLDMEEKRVKKEETVYVVTKSVTLMRYWPEYTDGLTDYIKIEFK